MRSQHRNFPPEQIDTAATFSRPPLVNGGNKYSAQLFYKVVDFHLITKKIRPKNVLLVTQIFNRLVPKFKRSTQKYDLDLFLNDIQT